MDFQLSDEQKLIRDAVEKFVRNDYGFDARNKLLATDEGFSRENWRQFAELGWLGIPFPEEVGGFGGAMVEILQIMEPFGTAMVLEPYLSTVVLGGSAIDRGAPAGRRQTLLGRLIEGQLMLALAYTESESRFNPADVATRAEKTASGYRLSGKKTVVLDAPSADMLIVSARSAGDRLDTQGISLFLVPADAKGLTLNPYRIMDGGRGADVTLDNVEVGTDALLGEEGEGFDLLEQVIDLGTAAACAQALGAMQAAYQRTVDYLKTRKQFDQPIGAFQALQHRAVDMFIAVESARSMTYMVAMKVGDPDPIERRKAVSAAKQLIGEKARFVAQQAVQLHGGIGMTEELDVGHYFRRLTLFCSQFGTTDYHLRRFADLAACQT